MNRVCMESIIGHLFRKASLFIRTSHEKSIGSARYFVLFKDDFSNFRKVYFLKEKSEVCRRNEIYFSLLKLINCTVLVLRSDNGTEFVNLDVGKLLEQHGTGHQRSVPYTPQHNGRAEREMRTIVEAARTLNHSKHLLLKFCAEALKLFMFCITQVPVLQKTKHRSKPSIDHLRVFGSEVFVHVPKEKRKKWNSKAKKGIFVGYGDDVVGYRNLDSRRQ